MKIIPSKNTTISNTGFWEQACNQNIDMNLTKQIIKFLQTEIKNGVKNHISDFGCGCQGLYVDEYLKNNINVVGYDGNPNTEKLTNGKCKVLDLTDNIKFENKYSWIICIEVGEHVPQNFEQQLINNLHNNCINGIILSWAVKGQGGHGHVNCQNNDYIKNIFKKLKYINDINTENILRKSSSLPWFKNTIMVFRKN